MVQRGISMTVRKYKANDEFAKASQEKLKPFEEVTANQPTGTANLKSLAKLLNSFNSEAIAVVVEMMRKQTAKDADRLNAAKFIISQTTNILAQIDRQKVMVKQMRHYDVQIQQAEIRNSLLSEEGDGGDDINDAEFTTDLRLIS